MLQCYSSRQQCNMHEFTDLPKLPLTSGQCSADKISLACIFFLLAVAT